MLRAEFSLPSIRNDEEPPERKAPIRVKFEIPYFTVSGIQVSCSIGNLLLCIWRHWVEFTLMYHVANLYAYIIQSEP